MAAERRRRALPPRTKPEEPPAPPEPAEEPVPFPREPIEPTEGDLADWARGAAALARMPARMALDLTEGILERRRAAQEELDGRLTWIERLRYETEEMLASGIGARLGARSLASIPTEEPPEMLIGRLDPLGHTILFGTGGVGKGTLASSWCNALLEDGRRILILDYENHPEEWSRRIAGLGAGPLAGRILHSAPLTAAWGGKRGAIWSQAEEIRDLALQWKADYVIVDSIVPACAGSDPLKPEASSLYAGAVEYIGLPILSLGHVTKADDLRYPFGSIFWHNLARTTWSLKEDGATTTILQHRKHNNYSRVPALRIEVHWSGAIPINVDETSYAESLSRRISEVLIGEVLTTKEVTKRINDANLDDEAKPIEHDTVYRALRRGAKSARPRFLQEGSDRWKNAP